ncbi:putative histone-lysine N-methyltransferase [Tanacetum coccineum]
MATLEKTSKSIIPRKRPLNDDDNRERGYMKDLGSKLKSYNPKELGRNKPSLSSKPPGKVKFWDPSCPEEGDAQMPKDTAIVAAGLGKEHVRREKIKEAMIAFDEVYAKLCHENKSKSKGENIAHWRVPMEAVKIVKQRMKWMDVDKTLGPICGVQVGDRFKFRSQLQMIGLHCQPQSGIDYAKIGGKNLAISIVDSHRYLNKRESCDVFSYSGQGGHRFLGSEKFLPQDQTLERGNLALKNSMNEKTPVRVIRKLQKVGKDNDIFVYDGLYIVKQSTQEKDANGKIVFMFELNRVPGQPQLHKMLNAS